MAIKHGSLGLDAERQHPAGYLSSSMNNAQYRDGIAYRIASIGHGLGRHDADPNFWPERWSRRAAFGIIALGGLQSGKQGDIPSGCALSRFSAKMAGDVSFVEWASKETMTFVIRASATPEPKPCALYARRA
jgi:hypothetical protein